ncbi:MAG TPA: hypothetical protein VMW49_03755 [Candidatus Dormibacteraeota bacterium]|nr:hypothetical protein [Candidatus Dormibacteraeota bacterium]
MNQEKRLPQDGPIRLRFRFERSGQAMLANPLAVATWEWRGIELCSSEELRTADIRDIEYAALAEAARLYLWAHIGLAPIKGRRRLGRRPIDDEFYREMGRIMREARRRAPRRFISWIRDEWPRLIPSDWGDQPDKRMAPSLDTLRRYRREVERRGYDKEES